MYSTLNSVLEVIIRPLTCSNKSFTQTGVTAYFIPITYNAVWLESTVHFNIFHLSNQEICLGFYCFTAKIQAPL